MLESQPLPDIEIVHRRVNSLNERVVVLEERYRSQEKKLDEISADLKELMRSMTTKAAFGGATGASGTLGVYILWQMMSGG